MTRCATIISWFFRGFFGFYKGIKGIKEGIKEFTKEFIILQELSGAVLKFFIPENAYNTIHFLEHTEHKTLLQHLCLLPLLGNMRESKVQTKVELLWDHSYL